MIAKFCPVCGKLMIYGKGCCEQCSAIVEAKRKENQRISGRKYDAKRNGKYVRFYHSKEWKMLREKKLSQCGYLCEVCLKKGVTKVAEDVHHIKPVKEDWGRRLDINNLMAVCVSCHNSIEKKGRAINKV